MATVIRYLAMSISHFPNSFFHILGFCFGKYKEYQEIVAMVLCKNKPRQTNLLYLMGLWF